MIKDSTLPEGIIKLDEQYFNGGYSLDNFTMNNGVGRDNYGYRYNMRALTHELEQKFPPAEPSFMYIGVGSRISAENRKGNRVTGIIRSIKRDADGYIKQVYILSDKTRRIIPVDIDTIRLLNRSQNSDFAAYIRESCDINKAVVANFIREQRNIDFTYKNNTYKAIIEKGMPTILKLNEGKVVSKRTILEVYDDGMIACILNKVTNNGTE